MQKITKNIGFVVLILFIVSCSDDLLDTENLNAPDLSTILNNPADWEGVIAKQFNVIWHATQHRNAATVMAGMSDVITSSWANSTMLFHTSEPRVEIRNSEGSNFVGFSYYENFKVIGSVNDILRLLNENPDVKVQDNSENDIREKLRSAAHFLRGMAYGNLSLKYDQAQYITEDLDLSDIRSIPYDSYEGLLEKALSDLEMAIGIASSASDFTVDYYNGVSLSKTQYIQLIRTLQATYTLHVSRSNEDNNANDWTKILQYALEGIDFDFSVMGDGNDWYDGFKFDIAFYPFSFARVDHRVIAAMAENVQSRFPEDNSHPLPEAVPIDNRLNTDVLYSAAIHFRPDRGLYHFSHYVHTRYLLHGETATGPMAWLLKAENDLTVAEALIHTGGDRQNAATLINITRVDRGQLPPLTGTESDQEFYDAIMHERFVELLATRGGQPFYDRRRLPDDDGSFHPYSGLQSGTAKQWPVPAQELNILGREIYTFGGL